VIVEESFMEISTSIPLSTRLYGLGESTNTNGMQLADRIYTLWNRDNPSASFDVNLYGSHPFLMAVSEYSAYGVFLLNSHGLVENVAISNTSAMDVIVRSTPESRVVTYRVVGGAFDFYFFSGPSPSAVVRQYLEVIGRPHIPPFWSLGFHNVCSNLSFDSHSGSVDGDTLRLMRLQRSYQTIRELVSRWTRCGQTSITWTTTEISLGTR
jgi:alpha-glucosidase (family GH31 glycosyl hydrolase)